jgi:leucyl/phenylalanyl-tRNA--protein transferase
VTRNSARRIRRAAFRVTVDSDFTGVVSGCADRDATWINDTLFSLYEDLHSSGHAHSLEVRDTKGALVGGVFGVTLGAAFFGESMFSRRRDASKVALAYLVARLRAGGFTLFDTQFITSHLASLGGIEIPRADYRKQLTEALAREADFLHQPPEVSAAEVLQRSAHTS